MSIMLTSFLGKFSRLFADTEIIPPHIFEMREGGANRVRRDDDGTHEIYVLTDEDVTRLQAQDYAHTFWILPGMYCTVSTRTTDGLEKMSVSYSSMPVHLAFYD